MRILLTGGAGFIGTASARAFAASGHDVTVFDDLREDVHDGRVPDLPDGVGLLQADIRDLDAVTAAIEASDVVVHLAAKVGLGVNIDDIDDYVSSNDLGTAVILKAAARAGTQHLVFASSMVVYGEGRYECTGEGSGNHGVVSPEPRQIADLDAGTFDPRCPHCGTVLVPGLVGEDAPLDPRNVYAATKVHGEHLLRAWSRETSASVTALRFHNVYGPGMPRDTPYAGVASIFRSELAHGRPPRVYEDGGQRRDFVHVDDVAAAVVRAAESPAGPGVTPLNIGSGTVTTVGHMAQVLAEVMDGPTPIVTGQYRAGDVRHVTASSDRAAEVLGWRAQISLRDGLAAMVGVSASH